jgi:glycosyltransferase involved in cell wall biosynthesis
MRILMLTEFYPPIIGGIEQHVRNLSTALVARGNEVAVATLWQEGLPEFENDRGVRVYRIRGTLQRAAWLFTEKRRRHVPPMPDPELAVGLRRVISQEHPDIVHAHNWLVHSFLPLKTWSGARLVVTLHDYGLVCANQRLWYHEAVCAGPGFRCFQCAAAHYGLPRGVPTVLANWTMGLAERATVDLFLPVSQAVATGARLREGSLPYQVIPNFVPDDVGAVKNDDGLQDAQLPAGEYLLFVGDLSVDKGVLVLLKAHAELARTIPLVLIGRPKATLPTDLKNVIIVPGLPHDAVMRAWRKSIMGLAPSIWSDPCPTVVMEAMATGRPVVAARIGGLIDLVSHEETGLLVPPGDVTALRLAMERLINAPDLRARMGQAAKRRVLEFQAQSVVPRIEQAYQQVAGAKEPRGK